MIQIELYKVFSVDAISYVDRCGRKNVSTLVIVILVEDRDVNPMLCPPG